ncbi:N-acetyl-D-Glu racemase DgcA [Sphingomonas prati]|uniref:Dipeptide epimerase n=1 Tax=Sphingomonas prati TaxID=1843237 RepID=A0A7W9F0V3_9SPHN|nr:N-acetyl-D-Glu racemase DgcA [Sphingomonas prati]MBB5728656.1 L-alanine-DL-glutamate epimerase-like enolase superfamily enzyme [Sphingomonas prati]GGE72102.1 dipeptide epimerase [Sphingomonas prati]
MLRRLEARHDRFGLSTPFRISRGVKSAADVVTVTIAQGTLVGRGEAVPYARYGETIEGALAAIASVTPLLQKGAGRAELLRIMPAGAARNAVDGALWDLDAQLAGTTVAALAGLSEPTSVASAITIGLDAPDAMATAAVRVADVPLLKIKVDRDHAAAQIAAVRAAAPAPRLIVDPNESWSIDEVTGLQDLLVDYRVDLLEQPLPADADGALTGFASRVPICADESLHTAADLDALAGRYTVVNVKLDKTGGLTEALMLADTAERKGFGLMVGCMVCSSLGIAPALLLAGRAAFVDLDGPLWLAEDRRGGVTDHAGMLSPPAPGFWGTPT